MANGLLDEDSLKKEIHPASLLAVLEAVKLPWFDMRKVLFILISGACMITTNLVNAADITLISDPVVLAIPIHDNQDTWVDLTKQQTINYGTSPEIPDNKDYTWLRKTVYEKLMMAQKNLPSDLHFCLYEGYRSLSLQKLIFEKHFSNVKKRHPEWSLEQAFLYTTQLVSPVINLDSSPNVPPHSTGAAIDVYLIDNQGQVVDMGIHPKDWLTDKEGALSLTNSQLISSIARKNRQIMSAALTAVGFVNYPTEYWHWSYGDRYWAHAKKKSYAVYGSYVAKQE